MTFTDMLEFPATRTAPFDPPEEYLRLLAGPRVQRARLWSGKWVWLVAGYDEVRTVLDDGRFSADMEWPNFPIINPQKFDLLVKGTFPRLDGTAHTSYRRMLAKEFTVRRMKDLWPSVEHIVEERLQQLAAVTPPADLVEEFALPVPSMVICRLLGLPYEDHAFFQERTKVALSWKSGHETIMRAAEDLREYLRRLVALKRRTPGDDLTSRLIADYERTGKDEYDDDLVTTISLLLAAGHETTANMIALGVFALLCHPEQFARLRADTTLIPGAVEELLRYLTITQFGIPRVAKKDTEVAGEVIRTGDGVIALVAAANRDPGRFAEPDRLDVCRNSRGHVAFGFGAHQCIGQALARVEIEIALTRLVDRLPTLRLAVPAANVQLRSDMFVYGVHELPVTW